MYIERITIKKFRSIVDSTFYASNITVFVGENDVGKSNILKALNLFFNNQTDVDQVLIFLLIIRDWLFPPKRKPKRLLSKYYYHHHQRLKAIKKDTMDKEMA